MKSSIKFILALIALTFISCQKDDTIYYNNVTMGNFLNGKFISDQGLTYDIIEQTCQGTADTLTRAMISCDILSKTEENRYDIRLNAFEGIFTKSTVDSTAVSDSSIFVENPLNIGEIWYSGGYLNLFIYIPMKAGSRQAHLINLVRKDDVASAEGYEFTLKHNAFGEVITADDTNFVLGSTYVSFPIANVLQVDKTNITIRWTSNVETDGKWSAETKRNSLTLEWERGGYEHKQDSVAPSSKQSQRWI